MASDEPEDGLKIRRGAVWMEDGNLIIQAGQTQFKVYKCILSRSSSIFCDVFSLPPSPSDPDATVDGCPVMIVHDPPEDMEHVLSAIHFADLGDPTARVAMDFSKVSAYLRLGIKYEIMNLRDHAIYRLKAQYPSTFKAAIESFHTALAPYINLGDKTHFDVIDLLHQEGLYSCLPMAYFMAIHQYNTEETLGYLHDRRSSYAFASDMLRTCLVGKDKLAQFISEDAFSWMKDSPSNNCMNEHEGCRYHTWAIWMNDGNIILQAGQTQFKVYKEILSRSSCIFRDIFSLPQPHSDESMDSDDCPIVVVHDSPEDMGHLLSAIFFTPLGNPTVRESMDFAKVSAYLRLGIKYEILDLRDHAIHRLKGQYPSSFKKATDSFKMTPYIKLGDATHFDVINLLHQEGLLSALPMAYFMAIHQYDTKAIFEHLHTNSSPSYAFASDMLPACLLGKEKLAHMTFTDVFSWLKDT
ncbi:hypothetical protein CVT24_004232, partial [Panaeolus cyanescens]